MKDEERMTGPIGRVAYTGWCIAVGRRDLDEILKSWAELPETVRFAWQMAAEAAIDEDYYERGEAE